MFKTKLMTSIFNYMKSAFIITILLCLGACSSAQIDFNKIKKQGTEILNGSTGTGLSNADIIKGLKEALTIGSNNSSSLASKVDAYYKNPKLFIPFPPEAKKIESTLRQFGQEKLANDFILSLNRAAEDAAKSAAPIFVAAVKNMTISDGLSILKGADNAATTYLQKSTQLELTAKFKPVIEASLKKVNATKYWADAINYYNKIPTVQKMNPDLSGYATSKAIDGLFVLVAAEELKIRKDPAARITDILKKVFGK